MKHIKTVFPGRAADAHSGQGCGECQTSCQSACKTSCTVANQSCEQPMLFADRTAKSSTFVPKKAVS